MSDTNLYSLTTHYNTLQQNATHGNTLQHTPQHTAGKQDNERKDFSLVDVDAGALPVVAQLRLARLAAHRKRDKKESDSNAGSSL